MNELVGFLGVTIAILMALSLLSYNPHDAALNVAAPLPGEGMHPARNWIGPVGAHGADFLFQVLGYAAFLLPVSIFVVGMRWFRSQAVTSPIVKLSGMALLMASLSALLALLGLPEVRGTVPAGGLLGVLLSRALLAGFNPVGAHVLAVCFFLTALFLTTRFSFSTTTEWLREKASPFAKVQARWKAWREAHEQKRLKNRVTQIQIAGRPPAPPQTIAPIELGEKPRKERTEPKIELTLVKSKDEGPAELVTSGATEPKIARGKTNYRLPSPGLLRMAERGEKLQEAELKERAHTIEQKCKEFDVIGHVTQINPGPVVTTYEFKPEAGVKYSRIIGLSDDLCLALKAESILMERIPGKSTVGIEVPNMHRETIVLRDVVESPEFVNSTSKLTMALGKDLVGRIRATELAQMPHLLIAGSTGTG
ncbi:MAG: DNA translocase FtsK 4TM domain-containing protein, partial [Acidobacteriales bacterium]|nr:DNA translocase FtsK 4TM domain-containing protein [Terriglobales bacterium]